MQSNIIEEINEQYNSLTRSNKKLADYILANKTSAQYMSITALAETCGISEATITRFCRTLGLSGYNEFKLALAKACGTTATGTYLIEDDTDMDDGSFDSMCKKLYLENITALNETLELANEEAVAEATRLMTNARHIYCFGQGGSNIIAMEAWARFAAVSSKFIHIQDSHMQAMTASLCTPQDVILFFSYSGSTKDMLDVVVPTKNGGAKVILVTHFAKSPASNYANVVLLCGSNESPLQSGSIAARISQLFIIDYLFASYCKANPVSTSDALNKTTESIAAKLL